MSKSNELNQRLGEDPEPKVATVSCGDEHITYNEEEVESFIVTGAGGLFVVKDGEIFRYSGDQVQELVYVDQGFDQEEPEEEDIDLEEEVREKAEDQLEEGDSEDE